MFQFLRLCFCVLTIICIRNIFIFYCLRRLCILYISYIFIVYLCFLIFLSFGFSSLRETISIQTCVYAYDSSIYFNVYFLNRESNYFVYIFHFHCPCHSPAMLRCVILIYANNVRLVSRHTVFCLASGFVTAWCPFGVPAPTNQCTLNKQQCGHTDNQNPGKRDFFSVHGSDTCFYNAHPHRFLLFIHDQ